MHVIDLFCLMVFRFARAYFISLCDCSSLPHRFSILASCIVHKNKNTLRLRFSLTFILDDVITYNVLKSTPLFIYAKLTFLKVLSSDVSRC